MPIPPDIARYRKHVDHFDLTEAQKTDLRGALDDQDAEPDGWYRAMRDAAGAFACRVTESTAWIVERRGELRGARRATEQELELSEGRRREAETELEAREVEMDRGLTH